MKNNEFSLRIINWYHQFGRKTLPWQINKSLYKTWISEIMLQQTQVATVIPYFNKFMLSYPSINSLANTPLDEILHHWTGLGYYARARNLYKTAQFIRDNYNGKFPTDFDQVIELAGIGRSTAGAILSLTLNKHYAILDGNVKRVLARHQVIEGWTGKASVENKLWALAKTHTPIKDTQIFNQAMMDLGATICLRRQPKCNKCPVNAGCLAFKAGTMHNYPTPKTKKKIPVKTAYMLIICENKQTVQLKRRPPTGIWGGLWCFGEFASKALYNEYLHTLDLPSHEKVELASFRHTFSHFHFDITPVLINIKVMKTRQIQEEIGILYYELNHPPKVGLATATQKILTAVKKRNNNV
ncbi:MAG: A/G-specific adenine glycosylase [Psychromonas sp.]|nr:A/G-specific adenine glycosylase [Psychromonas sp.]